MDELQVERVLRAVESIPAGSALPYGRVGRAAGASTRFVGRVMSVHGSAVAWWRVPNARGDFPPPLRARARPHLREEDTPLREDGRIDLRLAAPHPDEYVRSVDIALADLEDMAADPEDTPAGQADASAGPADTAVGPEEHGRGSGGRGTAEHGPGRRPGLD